VHGGLLAWMYTPDWETVYNTLDKTALSYVFLHDMAKRFDLALLAKRSLQALLDDLDGVDWQHPTDSIQTTFEHSLQKLVDLLYNEGMGKEA
jgi:hypothetical protein